jgi:hypothetical protein
MLMVAISAKKKRSSKPLILRVVANASAEKPGAKIVRRITVVIELVAKAARQVYAVPQTVVAIVPVRRQVKPAGLVAQGKKIRGAHQGYLACLWTATRWAHRCRAWVADAIATPVAKARQGAVSRALNQFLLIVQDPPQVRATRSVTDVPGRHARARLVAARKRHFVRHRQATR